MKLDWSALVMNKCPKCGAELEEDELGFYCLCGFKINRIRFTEIINSFEKEAATE